MGFGKFVGRVLFADSGLEFGFLGLACQTKMGGVEGFSDLHGYTWEISSMKAAGFYSTSMNKNLSGHLRRAGSTTDARLHQHLLYLFPEAKYPPKHRRRLLYIHPPIPRRRRSSKALPSSLTNPVIATARDRVVGVEHENVRRDPIPHQQPTTPPRHQREKRLTEHQTTHSSCAPTPCQPPLLPVSKNTSHPTTQSPSIATHHTTRKTPRTSPPPHCTSTGTATGRTAPSRACSPSTIPVSTTKA